MKRSRFYVGLLPGAVTIGSPGLREVFSSAATPTAATHPAYAAVIGPFRTKAGAEFMSARGYGNPHCRTVAEAERLAAQVAP